MKKYQFWFLTGSQHLYGEEPLKEILNHSEIMVDGLNKSAKIPGTIVNKGLVTKADEITKVMLEANNDPNCAGVITWMHTFSPSKMWIEGLTRLQKPMLHFHTQFNKEIPWETIDMDFMNLTQSAHGDREHGFIATRLRKPRKVVAGYWENDRVRERIGGWMRSAIGVIESQNLKVVRFGDNMREVAVTEGDKVEAQIKFGWEVNTQPVGKLVKYMDAVTEAEVDAQMKIFTEKYDIKTDNIEAVRYQTIEYIAIKKLLADEDSKAFTNTFQDLYGMKQLPGLASQELLGEGYGYGGEGDWKTSAMTRIMKVMAEGLEGGTAFMEDYTYHLEEGNELVLGAHMLEVCPTLAAGKPTIEVHELGIGDREAPARLVFNGGSGSAIQVSLIDMGGRFRLIVADVEAVAPLKDMPKLPVARVMWKPMPNLEVGAEAWILAGGAHHTVMSYSLTAEHMRDFADMMGIEFIHINKDTTIAKLQQELILSDMVWKLK
ncbi:L-arabinose isomerase [Clostridium cellulovorans]|uniref:L-arabinose isomerase n=2 Tax=Clostridium cellulovorans TaxID=1493 RepID=D9SUV4_CLOC7|nr:L-arabinose isomerase [Clostridium cellulovorans]ADL51009.1 L-arabinose isomerase [Clostridium cellulovorans 743B]BAV13153.1 L-arabinose isomerase [Clostridium cellulovorans]